ncbi:hypothetical protein MCP1_660005 [Candidatus Terasakiella magnetica]|nr:hypothetical protein MCP1_660005 [Candidatus Terasakiella magnetica]
MWRSVPRHVPIEGCAGLVGAEPQTWGTALMADIIFVEQDVHKARCRSPLPRECGAVKSVSLGVSRTGLTPLPNWRGGGPRAASV